MIKEESSSAEAQLASNKSSRLSLIAADFSAAILFYKLCLSWLKKLICF
jgi:hypothetical protein